MPAKPNDQSTFGEGDLNQDLIDQMLNGGSVEQDPWSDEALQAEIDAARLAAGVMTDISVSPWRRPCPWPRSPSEAPPRH